MLRWYSALVGSSERLEQCLGSGGALPSPAGVALSVVQRAREPWVSCPRQGEEQARGCPHTSVLRALPKRHARAPRENSCTESKGSRAGGSSRFTRSTGERGCALVFVPRGCNLAGFLRAPHEKGVFINRALETCRELSSWPGCLRVELSVCALLCSHSSVEDFVKS